EHEGRGNALFGHEHCHRRVGVVLAVVKGVSPKRNQLRGIGTIQDQVDPRLLPHVDRASSATGCDGPVLALPFGIAEYPAAPLSSRSGQATARFRRAIPT